MARRSDHTREELGALILTNARRIVREDGVDALTARKIAAAAGYTVGTIYQHFGNMDDLVHRLNGETLRMLLVDCSKVPEQRETRDRLFALAKTFVGFAVIFYRYGPGHEWSADYDRIVDQLLGLLLDATSALCGDRDQKEQILDVRLLWASMYGIFSLNANGRLGQGTTLDEMAHRLIDIFVRAMR